MEAGVGTETMRYASIFAARYRFAAAFDGLRVREIGRETVLGYETLMRLLLVQTKLEALSKVTGSHARLTSDPLASRLRSDSDLAHVLIDLDHRHIKHGMKEKEDEMINSLVAGDHADLAPVLRRVRNMFAHGDSTCNRFSLDRMARRRLLAELGDLGLEVADTKFMAWVDAHVAATDQS